MKLLSCLDINNGIGKNGKLPWYVPEDLKVFKQETLGKKIILGRKTLEKLPYLKEREIYGLSNTLSGEVQYGNNLVRFIKEEEIQEDMIICGGAELYSFSLKNNLVDCAILGRILLPFDCDTFFPFNLIEEKLELTGISNITENYRVEIWR